MLQSASLITLERHKMLDFWLIGKSRVRRGKFPLDESGQTNQFKPHIQFLLMRSYCLDSSD